MTDVRGILSNNIERIQNIIWDIENAYLDFDKEKPAVQGALVVAKQIEVSLTALRADIDNTPKVSVAVPQAAQVSALISAREYIEQDTDWRATRLVKQIDAALGDVETKND